MNCWPNASASRGVIVRATMSAPEPGGNETMTRTGFTGYDWAQTAVAPRIESRRPVAMAVRSLFVPADYLTLPVLQ